jgi:hypothetical protein
MIRGVCPWHVSLTPKWSAMATFELSSSSSSIIKEIQILRLNKLSWAEKKNIYIYIFARFKPQALMKQPTLTVMWVPSPA